MNPGTTIGDRFVIEELVAQGGMGAVFRARDRLTGELVAVKMLRSFVPQLEERFAREASTLAELHHPGIIRYIAHGSSTVEAEAWLAMEWLDGETLERRIGRSPLGIAESVELVRRVAEALASAHVRGIVHRDIKPSNLFLVGGSPSAIKILDFGVARVAGPARLTATGLAVGTPGYMAPEQARGERSVDARADVFGLGCVLFECLTGEAAFSGEHMLAILAKILFAEAPRMSERRRGLPPALDELVARMLAKDPAQRPADAGEVAAALAALGPLPDAPAPLRRLDTPVLTHGERRLLCVILVDRRSSSLELEIADATLPAATPVPDPLVALSNAHGGRAARLASGALVVVMAGGHAATDLAAQAARCALDLRSVAADAPIAIATGQGELGGPLPVGEVIDEAVSLLRSAGRDGEIAIDKLTSGLLDARFEFTDGAGFAVLRGERDAAAARTLLGRPTTMVGRDREMSTLEGLFHECVESSVARVAVVVAAPGVGKSRLCQEVLQRVRASSEVEVWSCRGSRLGAGAPFGLIAQLVRRAAGLDEHVPPGAERRRLEERLARTLAGDDHRRATTFLAELVGLGDQPESAELAAARRDPRLMGDQMLRAWEDWVAAESARAPLVIVLEDLHWGDLPSVEFVGAVLRNLGDRPLFVLALARPEIDDVFPSLWRDRALTTLRLPELARRPAEKLVRQVLGEATPADVVARVVERAGGNAFYLEEVIRAVAEGRGEALPGTVLAMSQARFEGLAPEARRILRAASVFGTTFWRGGVAELIGSAKDLDRWLQVLIASEVVIRSPTSQLGDESELGFRHTLLQEAAYQSLTGGDRTLGHRLAAGWLERVGATDAVVLANHFALGGAPDAARVWWRRAAEHALEGNDLDACLERVGFAIAAGASGVELGELRRLEGEALQWRGGADDAVEQHMREAMRLLPPDEPAWFEAAGILALAASRRQSFAELEALAEQLLAARPAAASLAAYTTPLGRCAGQLLIKGRPATAARVTRRLEEIAARGVGLSVTGTAWLCFGRMFMRLQEGDMVAALEAGRHAVAVAHAAGDRRNECWMLDNVGAVLLELGDLAEARAAMTEALATATRLRTGMMCEEIRLHLAVTLARLGEIAEARALQARTIDHANAMGAAAMVARAHAYGGLIAWLAGDPAAAERDCEAVELEVAEPVAELMSAAVLALALGARKRGAEALAVAERAFARLTELGGIDEGEALIRLARAEALAAAGRTDDARRAIGDACDRLRDRAAKIGDPAGRRRFLEQLAENARTLELARAWGYQGFS